ncbi:MAG: hypothetical protein RLZ25_990 [Pseudomonadota bacterium]
MMMIEYLSARRSSPKIHPLSRLLKNLLRRPLAMTLVVISLSACAPKKVDTPAAPPQNPFDYSRSDLGGLIEFANRFGALPDSARLAVCREMELSDKEKRNNPQGLTLHQAAGQIFLAQCSPQLDLQEKLKLLVDNPDTPPDQRQFASLALQLIVRLESQNNALMQAQKKARARSTGSLARRKPEGTERDIPAADDSTRFLVPTPLPDDVARKKLEAIRNLEKSMDRGLTP